MDYQIGTSVTIDGTNFSSPYGLINFEKSTDISGDILISLNTKQGSFFQNRSFGSQLYKIKKVTAPNIRLAQQYVQDALSWLITIGRAVSFDVLVEQDLNDINRLDIKIKATQPNGLIINYTHYYYVVGN